MAIHQGDQYPLPIKIMQGTQPLTPEDVTDLRIKVGKTMKSYSDGELDFDTDRNMWLFPMSEAMTRALIGGSVSVQVGVKLGNEMIYSAVKSVNVSASIITEVWGNG